MVQVLVKLSKEENKIVEVYKANHELKSKAQAIKKIITHKVERND